MVRMLQERPWSWDVSIHLDHSHWQSVFYEEYKLRSVTPHHMVTLLYLLVTHFPAQQSL